MSQLTHLIYASAATQLFHTHQLTQLLKDSRRNNERLDVTGMLLYIEGSFFQVLEGDPRAIETVYRKICGDPRHTRVTRIIFEAIPHRSFSNWSMGFSGLSRNEVAALVGLNDFGSNGWSLDELGNGRARKLLQAFADGRWRMKLTGSRAPSSLAA